MIIFEGPLVIGPKQATYPVCLACYRRVDGCYECTDCGWPLCGPQCQSADNDHSAECQFLVSQQVRIHVDIVEGEEDEDCRLYDCVAPLRSLLAMKKDDEREVLMKMETHHPHRKAIGIWEIDRILVDDVIRNDWSLHQHFTPQDIQTVFRIVFSVGCKALSQTEF